MIKKLTNVGGGSSGWMTAIYLNKLYNHSEKNFDITVIESPDIGIIGVGEATVHSVRFFFKAMGLDEHELLCFSVQTNLEIFWVLLVLTVCRYHLAWQYPLLLSML